MKVLIIVPSYKPAFIYGGPTMSVSEICENINTYEPSFILHVFTTTANGSEDFDVAKKSFKIIDGIPVKYFKRITKDHSHFSPSLLWNVWKFRKDYDIIHIHSWWNLVSILSVALLYFTKTKIILSPRGMLSPYTLKSKPKLWFNRLVGTNLLKRTYLHATSVMEYNECTSLVKGWDGKIIFNFVKLPENILNVKSTKIPDEISLLFLSRIDPKKGLEILFESLTYIKSKYKIKLKIAGNGDEAYINQLKELTKNLQIDSIIEWVGPKHNEEKFKFYQSGDFFILPSYNENFANVVIESLAVGTPVIISENVGIKEYILEKNLGWVCKSETSSLSDVILTAISDEQKRKIINNQAPQLIYNDFTGQKLILQYLQMYNQL